MLGDIFGELQKLVRILVIKHHWKNRPANPTHRQKSEVKSPRLNECRISEATNTNLIDSLEFCPRCQIVILATVAELRRKRLLIIARRIKPCLLLALNLLQRALIKMKKPGGEFTLSRFKCCFISCMHQMILSESESSDLIWVEWRFRGLSINIGPIQLIKCFNILCSEYQTIMWCKQYDGPSQ